MIFSTISHEPWEKPRQHKGEGTRTAVSLLPKISVIGYLVPLAFLFTTSPPSICLYWSINSIELEVMKYFPILYSNYPSELFTESGENGHFSSKAHLLKKKVCPRAGLCSSSNYLSNFMFMKRFDGLLICILVYFYPGSALNLWCESKLN